MLKLLVGVACAAGAFGLCTAQQPAPQPQVSCGDAVAAWAKPGYVDDATKTRVAWYQMNGQVTDGDMKAAMVAASVN